MSATSDETLEVVRQWVQKAESDFTSAVHLLGLKQKCPTDSVCFHVQHFVVQITGLHALKRLHKPDPQRLQLGQHRLGCGATR